jgi:predicted DNA-binding transcriptional regulator AlpA
MEIELEKLYSPAELAKILQISQQTLAIWRLKKTYGPSYVKLGGLVRYRSSDVTAWIAQNQIRSES